MNYKRIAALLTLSAWALLALTYTRPWPQADSLIAALAIIVVGLSLWVAVFAPLIYFIGVPLYRRNRRAKA